MIKAKWGYGKEENQDKLVFPKGQEEGEKAAKLRKRRIFYEVVLHDWIVRHDVDGDGLIIKTIHDRGVGYDRPIDFDEITLDLKTY